MLHALNALWALGLGSNELACAGSRARRRRRHVPRKPGASGARHGRAHRDCRVLAGAAARARLARRARSSTASVFAALERRENPPLPDRSIGGDAGGARRLACRLPQRSGGAGDPPRSADRRGYCRGCGRRPAACSPACPARAPAASRSMPTARRRKQRLPARSGGACLVGKGQRPPDKPREGRDSLLRLSSPGAADRFRLLRRRDRDHVTTCFAPGARLRPRCRRLAGFGGARADVGRSACGGERRGGARARRWRSPA